MKELGVQDLMSLHALGIARWGGDGSVPATAPDAMGSVLHSALYNEGLLGYAAGILCYIARAQHFTDGNKRTAWLGCTRALEVNGFYLKVETPDAISLVERIVLEHLDPADVAEQLAPWLEVIE